MRDKKKTKKNTAARDADRRHAPPSTPP